MGTTDANVVGGDAQAAAELKNRLRAEQIAALFQNVSLGVIGAACGAVILAGGLIALGAGVYFAALWCMGFRLRDFRKHS